MNVRKALLTVVHIVYDIVMKLNPRKLAASAVIIDAGGRVLVLHSRYVGDVWTLPGGGVDRGENLDEAVLRECLEELGLPVTIAWYIGMYYHADVAAYVAAFRCHLAGGSIRLSHEHTEYRWVAPAELPPGLRQVAEDALAGPGPAVIRTFR
ncbi:MAG TPA: NUDIX domain-containing protein [Symbiobacteriaceae bacterium]|jgi:8-oxo-dGTP pyrophosphatase MutT (NUDIX family)